MLTRERMVEGVRAFMLVHFSRKLTKSQAALLFELSGNDQAAYTQLTDWSSYGPQEVEIVERQLKRIGVRK